MTIGRPQIEKEIDIFNEGGEVMSPEVKAYYDPNNRQMSPSFPEVMSPEVKAYYDRVQAASERKPTSFEDISSRANELSALFPQTRQASFGDLAIALSRGLAQQASTGRPSSLGYGLAAGFGIFNEAQQQKRAAADAMRQKLMLMAYEDIERRGAESRQLQKDMLEADFEFKIEQMKNTGGTFKSTTIEAQAWNFVLRAEEDPSLKETAQYRAAVTILEKPRRNYQQTEAGTVMIEQPGYDLSKVIPKASVPTDTSQTQVPAGYTPTGRFKDGKMVYQRINADTGNIEYGVF
jgi:hypothetical protein